MDRYLDALRMKWYRYIINYSWRDQQAIAINVRHQTIKIRDKFNVNFSEMLEFFKTKIKSNQPEKIVLYVILTVFILILGKKIFSLPALRWRKNSYYKKNVPEVYLKMLALLRKKGFEKKETVTAKEFICQIKNDVGPAWEKIEVITNSYYETRFGNREPDKGKSELEQSLKALSSQLPN